MLEEANLIQSYLTTECGNTSEEIKDRIATLSVYMARSGEMLAQAKKALRKKKASEISNTIIAIAKQGHLSAKVQNTMLDSIAEEEHYLVDFLDRINRACTHQIDGLRSVLSYEKEHLRLSRTGY